MSEAPSSSSAPTNDNSPRGQEKSVWQNIKEPIDEVYSWYRSVDIKATVGKYREKINQDVFDNPTLKRIEHWPHKPKEVSAEIDRDLRSVSLKFNESFPYTASMCRSHPALVLGSFIALTTLPIWSRGTFFSNLTVIS